MGFLDKHPGGYINNQFSPGGGVSGIFSLDLATQLKKENEWFSKIVTDGLILYLDAGNKNSFSLFKCRYIRWSANGSTSNGSTHFVELQANTTTGTNRASGIASTIISGTYEGTGNASTITNGNTSTGDYYGFSGAATLQIDLGAVYDDIYNFNLWMYYGDERKYYDVKLEISTDGITFKQIYFNEYVAVNNTIITPVFKDLSGYGNNHSINNLPAYNGNSFSLTDGSLHGFTLGGLMNGVSSSGTVQIWYKTSDIAELWVIGNKDGSTYISASNNNNYYHGNAGSITNYVDLNTVQNPYASGYKNNVYHMFEAKNVNFSTWQYFGWFLYPDWQMTGTVASIMVYNKVLTPQESEQNFKAIKERMGV